MALGNIHLTPELVQAVRDIVDIVDIVREHTRLTKAGHRYKGLCPLHKEKTPSFSVDPVQGLFYCFGCSRGGDAIRLHELLTGDDFPGAIESLAQRYGIPLPKQKARSSDGKPEFDLEAALEAAQSFFVKNLQGGSRRYLEERQIPEELIQRVGVGYAPDAWTDLVDELTPGIPLGALEAAGIVGRSQKSGKPYDRFRHRLMFPIRAASGRLVGFGGRTLGDDKAKYINTAETQQFSKGYLLYALDRARRTIRDKGVVFLVEGYFDVIGAEVAGIDWTVASMGTALTEQQARLIARYADEVVVGYDGDEAGEKAFRRALAVLLAAGLTVRRARFETGHDPDSLRQESGPDALVELVEEAPDAVSLEIVRLIPADAHQDPRRRASAAREAKELLKPIRDGILRYGYAQQAATRLGIPLELFWKGLDAKAESGDQAAQNGVKSARMVRSLEERALQLMLLGTTEIPPKGELPPPDSFFDRECRNIFSVFCDLYVQEGTVPPNAEAVRAALGEENSSVDQLARLLLEEAPADKAGELSECFAKLMRRWRKKRLRELTVELVEAERQGETETLERLLDEKTALGRLIHQTEG